MNKITVVHIIGVLGRGGAERFVIDLCNELAQNEQYKVYLVSLCTNDADTAFLQEINEKVNYVSFNKGTGFSLSVLLQLTSWLVKHKAEIIHTHLNALEYLLLYRFRNRKARFFHTIHSTAEAECPGFLIKTLRKGLYKRNLITPIAVSNNGMESFKKYYKLDNVLVIENGRPFLKMTNEYPDLVKKYKLGTICFLLIHVGRVIKVKNQRLLIEAVQMFNAQAHKKCKLLLIGEVRDQVLYQELLKLVGTDQYIDFLGGKDNIADYLALADFFCLSSFYEGMPISLIEALSVGCIPICTRVGGINDMIDNGYTGFLSEDNSVDAYCQTIKNATLYPNKSKIRENSINEFKLKYHIAASGTKHTLIYGSNPTNNKHV